VTMEVPRHNRFVRKGRSNHSPSLDINENIDDRSDIELGPYAPSWIHDEGEATTSDDETRRPAKGRKSQALQLQPPESSRLVATSKRDTSFFKSRRTKVRKPQRCTSRTLTRLTTLIKTALMSLGAVQCLMYLCLIVEAFFPDEVDLLAGPFKDHFASPDLPGIEMQQDLQSLTSDVQPFMCHSHNDYWRREPLFQAISAGCTGVEADMWLFNDELFVAHTPSGVRRNRTLSTLYLDPIMQILDQKNAVPDFIGLDAIQNFRRTGIFDTKPEQSLTLLIDFKRGQNSTAIWDHLSQALEPFRSKQYLTYAVDNRIVTAPLTMIVSGHPPYDRIFTNSTYRDIFFDAPLECLAEPDGIDAHGQDCVSIFDNIPTDLRYSPTNSYYASTSFMRSIGYPTHSSLTQAQLNKIRTQIRAAHALGLKVRYWGIPAWPIGVRNYLWRVLVREGVDYLSVDDIDDVRWKDWGPRKGGWGKKWWR
jgi:hypothetical protein